MKRKFLVFLSALSVYLTVGSAFAQLPSQPFLFGLWEGTMTVVPQREDNDPVVPGKFEGEAFNFRLDIKDTNLVMQFQTGPDSWASIGEGADLRLNQAGRSAIVVAAMATGDPTETWMLNITRWDEQTIAVFLTQLVSPDDANGQAARPFIAFGQMERI